MHSRKVIYVSIVGLATLQVLGRIALLHVTVQLQQFNDIPEILVNVCHTVPDARKKVQSDFRVY